MTDDKTPRTDDIDEFAIEDEFAGDLADIEESSLDDEFEEGDEFSDDIPAGEKSGNKSILLLLLILLIIGGAGYFFLGKSLPSIGEQKTPVNTATDIPPVPSAPNMAAQMNDTMPSPLPPPPMPTPIGPDTGADITPISIDSDISDEEVASVDSNDTTVTTDDLLEDMGVPVSAEKNELAPATPETLEVVETELQENIIPALPDMIESAKETIVKTSDTIEDFVTEEDLEPAVDSTNNENVDQSLSTAIDQRMQALEQNIQSLMTRLDEVTTSQQQEPSPEITGSLAGEDKEALDTLSQQMLQVTHRLDQLSDKINTIAQQPKAPAKATPKPAQKAATPTASVKKVTEPAASWVLKSAQPGVAWLSKGESSEMQRYSVGQNVSGFGIIQSVTQENGQWVVRSQNGVIKQ